jgi:hypothetical protein
MHSVVPNIFKVAECEKKCPAKQESGISPLLVIFETRGKI